MPGPSSGINYLLLPRLILQRSRTAEQAVQLLRDLKMAGKGLLFMLMDGADGIRAVEKGYDRHAVRTATDYGRFSANCFVTTRMQDFPPRADRKNAAYRVANLDHLFQQAR